MNPTEQQLIAKAKSIKKQKEATEEKLDKMLTKKNTKSTRSLYKTLNSSKFRELDTQKSALHGLLEDTLKALNGDYTLTGDDATEFALDLLSFSEAAEKLAQGAQGAMDGSKAVYDVYTEETLPKKFLQVGQYAIENAIDALPGQADKLASAVYYPLKWGKKLIESTTGINVSRDRMMLNNQDPTHLASDSTKVTIKPKIKLIPKKVKK